MQNTTSKSLIPLRLLHYKERHNFWLMSLFSTSSGRLKKQKLAQSNPLDQSLIRLHRICWTLKETSRFTYSQKTKIVSSSGLKTLLTCLTGNHQTSLISMYKSTLRISTNRSMEANRRKYRSLKEPSVTTKISQNGWRNAINGSQKWRKVQLNSL